MPVLDGWRATREIKAAPETANIPVVAVTADASVRHAGERLRDAGFTECLVRPCKHTVMLQEVQNWIGSPNQESVTEPSGQERGRQRMPNAGKARTGARHAKSRPHA